MIRGTIQFLVIAVVFYILWLTKVYISRNWEITRKEKLDVKKNKKN